MPIAPESNIIMDFKRCITEGRKPAQRGGHTAVLAGGRLIVFGGHRYEKDSKFSYFSDVYMLDLENFVWKEAVCSSGATILPRYGHSATLVGSRLFVFGGRGESGMLFRDMHVLDVKQWVWAPVTSQSVGPSPRTNHASLLVGRKIVVHGGWNGESVAFDDLWVFDTRSFAWSQPRVGGVAPSPRYGHTLSLLPDGRILLFGGACLTRHGTTEYQSDLRELDTETMVWSRTRTAGDGPAARFMHTASVVGQYIIVYGGWGVGGLQSEEENKRQGAGTMYFFDTRDGSWRVPRWVKERVNGKYGHTTTVTQSGELMTFGGWDGKQALNDAVVLQLVQL